MNMTKNGSNYYWWCQIGGWGSLALVLVLNSSVSEQNITHYQVEIMAITVFTGILVTHIFREVIKRSGWAFLAVEKALPKFLIGMLVTCFVSALIRMGLADALGLASNKNVEFITRLLTVAADTGVMIIPWTLIYYFYHYVLISG